MGNQMNRDKTWPSPGDRLLHRFRRRPGEVVAEVLSVDVKAGKVAVRVDGVDYTSLSAAAEAIGGGRTNGWIYWGLKKQKAKQRNT